MMEEVEKMESLLFIVDRFLNSITILVARTTIVPSEYQVSGAGGSGWRSHLHCQSG